MPKTRENILSTSFVYMNNFIWTSTDAHDDSDHAGKLSVVITPSLNLSNAGETLETGYNDDTTQVELFTKLNVLSETLFICT